jgi:AraC-like DNA-binding protein
MGCLMTNARGVGLLPDVLLERLGEKARDHVFESVGLPPGLIENRDQRIPIESLAKLFEQAANSTSDPYFGLDVGLKMLPGTFGLWAHYAMQGANLRDALMRASRTLQYHQDNTRLRIKRRPGNQVAWEYWHPHVNSPMFRQHTDHVSSIMIRFIREFTGRNWRPQWIEVGYSAPRWIGRLEEKAKTEWVFDQPAIALVMPSSMLSMRGSAKARVMSGRLISLHDLQSQQKIRAPVGRTDRFVAIITMRLLDGLSDIEGVANTLDMSVRSLQRELNNEGLTYRSLLTHCRMTRAESLIRESDAPLKRIGFELGYSDPAHFTRAYIQYFGHPPSVLRQS